MYGQPLNPKRTAFLIYLPQEEGDSFSVYLTDMDDPSNDDVREVDHPDWELLWGNLMENVFEPWDQKSVTKESHGRLKAIETIEEARAWLKAIGMTEETSRDEENDPRPGKMPDIDWGSIGL